MRALIIGAVAAFALAIGFVAYTAYRGATGSEEPFGVAFTLVDQKGRPVTEAAFRDQPSAVFFGFTHCPEICPTTLYELDGWLAQLGDEGKDIKAYFVSVDPERDTPEILDGYVSAVSDRITGITGPLADVEAMLKGYKVYWRKQPLEGADYTMDHTASIFLLGKGGRFAGTIAYGENPEIALEKLKRLARS